MTNRLHLADVFAVAYRRLDRASMVRGDLRGIGPDETCPVDLIGAINYAACGDPGVTNASYEALDAIVQHLELGTKRDQVDEVADWCDRATQQQCLDLLMALAIKLEPRMVRT